MANTLSVDPGTFDGFTDNERWRAEDLVRRHGIEAENIATLDMIEALDGGDIEAIISRLRVRRCVRRLTHKEPYMRRLTDKIAAAVEQALEQGRTSLAQRLKPAFIAAREVEKTFQLERRSMDAQIQSA